MAPHNTLGEDHSRRRVLADMGGIGMLSLSGVPLSGGAQAQGAAGLVDPYTRDTYRSIVDAIVPETPGLESELGQAHVPGGLSVALEDFLVYDLNNFQEIHAGSISEGDLQLDEGVIIAGTAPILNGLTATTRGILEGLGVETAEDIFGDFQSIAIETQGSNPDTGAVRIAVTVETTDGTATTRQSENYPYAELFAIVFDLVAAEFVASGRQEGEFVSNDAFPAGGLLTVLSPRDRLRVLESIIEGSVLDALEELLGEILPTIGILNFGVMAVLGLPYIGYYSEWAGYGGTADRPPNERELQVPTDEVLGHRQVGFPGLRPGYAAHRGFEVDSFRENDWQDHFDDGTGGSGDSGSGGWGGWGSGGSGGDGSSGGLWGSGGSGDGDGSGSDGGSSDTGGGGSDSGDGGSSDTGGDGSGSGGGWWS